MVARSQTSGLFGRGTPQSAAAAPRKHSVLGADEISAKLAQCRAFFFPFSVPLNPSPVQL